MHQAAAVRRYQSSAINAFARKRTLWSARFIWRKYCFSRAVHNLCGGRRGRGPETPGTPLHGASSWTRSRVPAGLQARGVTGKLGPASRSESRLNTGEYLGSSYAAASTHDPATALCSTNIKTRHRHKSCLVKTRQTNTSPHDKNGRQNEAVCGS